MRVAGARCSVNAQQRAGVILLRRRHPQHVHLLVVIIEVAQQPLHIQAIGLRPRRATTIEKDSSTRSLIPQLSRYRCGLKPGPTYFATAEQRRIL